MRRGGYGWMKAIALVSLGACSALATSTTDDDRQGALAKGNGTDTTKFPVSSMHIHGRVLAIVPVPATSSGDTLRFDAIGGASVKVQRNTLVNGVATQTVVAQVKTGTDGRYDIPSQPGGYYVVTATGAGGSGYGENYVLVPVKSDAEVDVYLGKAEPVTPSAAPDDAWSLDGRIAALEAFLGKRASSDAQWSQTTVEGKPIHYAVHASFGKLVFDLDERADGGGVRQYTLVTLELVRYYPSVWQGYREISKEYVVPVGIGDARAQPNARYFLRGTCAAESCEQMF